MEDAVRKVYYKMNSKLLIGILIGGLFTTNVFSGYTVYATEGDKTADYTSMEEYAYFESVIGDSGAANGGNGGYALYDLDQDGIRELIVSSGECNADWQNYVYMIENGAVSSIGIIPYSVMFYETEDHNGIYSVYGHMGYQIINRVTKQGGQIQLETIMEGDIGSQEYYSNPYRIPLADFPGYGSLTTEVVQADPNNPLSGTPNYTINTSATGDSAGYLFPDSSNYKFQGYSDRPAWMYQYGINEIYAKHGYIFQTPEVAALFTSKTWYIGNSAFDESMLTEIERYNIDYLSKCIEATGKDGGYGLPSNEQSEPSGHVASGNYFDECGGYYTSFSPHRVINIYGLDPAYSAYGGSLEFSKDPETNSAGWISYCLDYISDGTALIVSTKKGITMEMGYIYFYDGEVYIDMPDSPFSGTYVEGLY